MRFSIIAEVHAVAIFGCENPLIAAAADHENVNWRWCVAHATYRHNDELACEFIVYVGSPDQKGDDFQELVVGMRDFGCSAEFIDACASAREAGANQVLFYV